jgi:hypothetical protein
MHRREFERLIDEVLDTLPDWALAGVENLRVVVEEWPTEEQDPDDEGLLGCTRASRCRSAGWTTWT